MFDDNSRYAELTTYTVKDHRGRTVVVVPVPDAPDQTALGIYLMRQGQRIDHLAWKYLGDPAGFWRICEINDAMLPEALTEATQVTIPQKSG
jgi:hypothetical protein